MATLAQLRTQISDNAQNFPNSTDLPMAIGLCDGVTTAFYLPQLNPVTGSVQAFLSYLVPGSSSAPPTTQYVGFTGFTMSGNQLSVNPISTTSGTAVPSIGSAIITPTSMDRITVGQVLLYDSGGNQEPVTVTAVTATTFTATFAKTHLTGVAIAAAAISAGITLSVRYQATYFSDSQLTDFLTRATADYSSIDDRMVLKGAHYDLIDVILSDIERFTEHKFGDRDRNPSAITNALVNLKKALLEDLKGTTAVIGRNIPSLGIGSSPFTPYDVQR